MTDTARFRLDDPDELVLASLACPLCLAGSEPDWRLDLDGYDPSVLCRCDSCQESWEVFLTPDQALRLGFVVLRAGR